DDLVAGPDAALVEALQDEQVALRGDELPVVLLGLEDGLDNVALEAGDGVAFGVLVEADLGEVHIRAEVAEQRLVEADGPIDLVGRVGGLAGAVGIDVGVGEVLLEGELAAAGEGAAEAAGVVSGLPLVGGGGAGLETLAGPG